jgi:hypothetical protein
MVALPRAWWMSLSIVGVVLLVSPAANANPADYVWMYGDSPTSVLPDPYQSTFDEYVGRSPVNGSVDPVHQYTFHGVLRDNQGIPVVAYPANLIELEILAPCANPVVLNPDAATNVNGELFFGPLTMQQGGGSCGAPVVAEVRVNGLVFASYDRIASPDQNGDGLVALSDLQIWQQAFVQQTPLYQGDLDFDDVIALSDLAFWQAHFTAP